MARFKYIQRIHICCLCRRVLAFAGVFLASFASYSVGSDGVELKPR